MGTFIAGLIIGGLVGFVIFSIVSVSGTKGE